MRPPDLCSIAAANRFIHSCCPSLSVAVASFITMGAVGAFCARTRSGTKLTTIIATAVKATRQIVRMPSLPDRRRRLIVCNDRRFLERRACGPPGLPPAAGIITVPQDNCDAYRPDMGAERYRDAGFSQRRDA